MAVRIMKTAAWLGWQVESNWTTWYYYLLYHFTRPVFSILILVFMYLVLTVGQREPGVFYFAYSGSAFFIFILGSLQSFARLIHEDREHYQILKYIYMAPSSFYFYLVGRGLIRAVLSLAAAVLVLVMGVIIFHLPLVLNWQSLTAFVILCVLGIIAVLAIGLLLTSLALVTAVHQFFSVSEAVSSIFYLFCGVLFPISSLPSFLQPVGKFIPFTYWLELMRRYLLPSVQLDNGFGQMSTFQLSLAFLLVTAVTLVLSSLVFNWTEKRVRSEGLIDMTTSH